MSSDTFDPDRLLNATITEAEYEGKKALTPEGSYPSCTITDVRAFEPHEKAKEKGVEARFLVVFDCPTFDGDLSTFINYKRPLNAKATYTKLMKAVWPDKKVALTKKVMNNEFMWMEEMANRIDPLEELPEAVEAPAAR